MFNINIENDNARREKAEKKLLVLQGDYRNLVLQELAKLFSAETYKNLAIYPDCSKNIYRRVIDAVGTPYQYPYSRKVENGDVGDWPSSKTMSSFARTVFALGDACLLFRPDSEGNPKWMAIPPDGYDCDIDGLTGEITNLRVFSTGREGEQIILYWDNATHQIFSMSGEDLTAKYGLSGKNDLGRIPAVLVSYSQDFPFDDTRCDDLYQGTLTLGVLSTLLVYSSKFAAIKTPVVRLPRGQRPLPQKLVLDPAFAWQIDGDASVSVLDFSLDLEGLRKVIESYEASLLSSWGLSSDIIRGQSSGYALKVARSELERHRRELQVVCVEAEKKIADLLSSYYNRDIGVTLDFNFEDDTDIDDATLKLVEMGIVSPLDIMRRNNPELTEEELVRKFEENKRLVKNAGEISIGEILQLTKEEV